MTVNDCKLLKQVRDGCAMAGNGTKWLDMAKIGLKGLPYCVTEQCCWLFKCATSAAPEMLMLNSKVMRRVI